MVDSRKKRFEHKSYTPWHILLDDVMAYFFDAEEIEVRAFEKLGTLPLESDFIILRKKKEEEELLDHYPEFGFLLPYLGQVTVLEYKSPLDRLRLNDFDLLRIYRLLVKRKYKLTRDAQVWAVSLTSRFEKGYSDYIKENGYKFKEIEAGIWGHEGEHERFYWLDLAIIGQKDPENFINLFSSNYHQYRHSIRIKKKGADILSYILQSIFKKELIKMRHQRLRHLNQFLTSMEEIRKSNLESYTVKERLAGLKAEERLAGLKAEERLAGLSKRQLEQLKKLLEKKL